MNVLIDGEIVLYGTVGEDLWGDGFTARDVAEALAIVGRNAPLTVRVNSPGGYTSDGAAIHAMLANRPGETTVIVEGMAASAASVIAMAGGKTIMRKGAVMMVHDPSGITLGTARDHQKSIEALNAIAATMADIYAEKTGRPVEDIRAEMSEEIWLTPAQALEKGYVDLVDDERDALAPTAFDYRLYKHAPQHVLACSDTRPPRRDRSATAARPAATPRQQEQPMATEEAGKKPAETEMIDAGKIAAEARDKAVAETKRRISAIMSSDAAKGREDQARFFAFDTDLTAEQAVAALERAPKVATAASAFEARMAATPNPTVGLGAQADDDEAAVASQIVALFKKGA